MSSPNGDSSAVPLGRRSNRAGEMVEPLASLAGVGEQAWLVGGALRDRLLGRPSTDYDVVVAGDVRGTARALSRRAGGHAFRMSEGFGAWRVISHERSWQIDLLPLVAGSIEGDLSERDLTINAIAQPLGSGELIDPFGGLEDLDRGRLRMVAPSVFSADPLRTFRLARLACELGFSVDPPTAVLAAESAPGLRAVAAERVFAELRRVISSEGVLQGFRLMDELAVTEVVLPELSRLRGIEQSAYHHLDAYEHTLAVLAATVELERDPGSALGAHAEAISHLLGQPFANELTRWQALRLGALFHDVGKSQTRGVSADGRVTFIGHDAAGAGIATAALTRLRASERLSEHVAALARHHLRLGFLVHEMPIDRRTIYEYLRACSPVHVDVTVLSVADRLGTRGSGAVEAIAKHLKLAGQLLCEGVRWDAEPPRPPVRGDELALALGISPGPELGRILGELEAASFAGEIGSREEALERARQLLRQGAIRSNARDRS